jgi:carboxypeptidase family protein
MPNPLITRTVAVATFVVLGGTIGASTLGAQRTASSTLVAGVADAETGQPLEGAEVILLGVHRLARANALGEATIGKVPAGPQRVRVRRLGYAPAEIDIAMTGDTTGAVFRLQRSAVQLGTVNVEAEWVPPKMKDVEGRRRQGIGRFLSDEQLDTDRDRDFQLALTTRLPGLKTVIDSNGHRVLASTRDNLGLGGISPCYTTVYLDDMLIQREDADLIRTWDLAAVEYYASTEVPVRYRTKAYGCGVLLLWSKWR